MCCVSGEKMAAPSITLFPEKKSPTNGHGSPGRAGKTSWVIFTFFFYRLISSGLNVFNSALSLLSYGPTRVHGPSDSVLSGVTITSRVVFHSSSGHFAAVCPWHGGISGLCNVIYWTQNCRNVSLWRRWSSTAAPGELELLIFWPLPCDFVLFCPCPGHSSSVTHREKATR